MALQHPLPAALDSGGRLLSLTAYTRRLALRPKGVFFFRLKVYERGGILIFKVYERLDKAVIWSGKRAKQLTEGVLAIFILGKTGNSGCCHFYWGASSLKYGLCFDAMQFFYPTV